MCSDSVLGLLNPEVNPRKYEDFRCPCEAGVAVCPSNISGTGLWKYRSVSSDEFYDLSENDVRFWAIRTHAELKHIRYLRAYKILVLSVRRTFQTPFLFSS